MIKLIKEIHIARRWIEFTRRRRSKKLEFFNPIPLAERDNFRSILFD
jgi:hypothetical protein